MDSVLGAKTESFCNGEVEIKPKILLDCFGSQPAEVTNDSEQDPVCGSPRKDEVIKEVNVPDTLKSMYDTLKNSIDDYLVFEADRRHSVSAVSNVNVNLLVAKVWVVRYVDFTSKYGLGFLFNTGSSGVYFNDSTKIVLSEDGKVFQYTERRRGDLSKGLRHPCQKHLLSSYPPELAKKVGLLMHFHRYLIDHHRAAQPTDRKNGPRVTFQEKIDARNACVSVQYNPSDTRCNSSVADHSTIAHLANKENEYRTQDRPNGAHGEDTQMSFLKKWVRTKHAILFILSNHTIQVVFYDRSEVLLSSEPQVITYVSAFGKRSEHSLDDILTTDMDTCNVWF